MKVIKSAQSGGGNVDNIGVSTSRYIRPLVLKIVASFFVMVGLLVVLTVFVLLNLNQGHTNINKALDAQLNIIVLQQLHEAVMSERTSVLNTLYTGQTDPNLQTYQNNFEQAEQRVSQNSDEIYTTSSLHKELKQLYATIIATNATGQAAQARVLWQTAQAQTDKLLTLLNNWLSATNDEAVKASTEANQIESQAGGSTLWLALLGLVVMTGLAFFVFASVLAPLRRLNQNLAQLLWTQTEHLTDQLNVMQTEINVHQDMLTTVRHDLKSPLSSIKGLAELCTILQPNLTGDVSDNLEKIVEMADTSVETISDVLARREQRLDLQVVQVGTLVDKVLQLVDLRYYNVQRKVEADEWVLDPGLIEHTLLNLVSNARKFSTQGIGVGVRKIRKPGTVDIEELELWVWNDGAVINSEDRNEIFKPGKQTPEGKKAGGHGLGLYIVKTLAERHHGRVTVESHEKIGTTFRVYIPHMIIESNEETSNTSTMPDDSPELTQLLNSTS